MKTDEIIEMARQADIQYREIEHEFHSWWADGIYIDELEAFAKLVAAKEREHYDDLFAHIQGWCEAYPIAAFPEPDFKKAHEVLTANGMTLDAISASNMKHVITQVQKMIDAAIRARGEA
jgi:hypothetical protein